uniref:Uncharacterized protein n=1 Tax=Solanum tuberosum TaxID=4113 RepID=M1DDN7_SOLTU
MVHEGSSREVDLSTCRGLSHKLLPLAFVGKAWSMRALHEPWKLPRVVVPLMDSSLTHAAKAKFTRGLPRAVELSTLREPTFEVGFLPIRLRHRFARAFTGSE